MNISQTWLNDRFWPILNAKHPTLGESVVQEVKSYKGRFTLPPQQPAVDQLTPQQVLHTDFFDPAERTSYSYWWKFSAGWRNLGGEKGPTNEFASVFLQAMPSCCGMMLAHDWRITAVPHATELFTELVLLWAFENGYSKVQANLVPDSYGNQRPYTYWKGNLAVDEISFRSTRTNSRIHVLVADTTPRS
jgi:hypothetical protein